MTHLPKNLLFILIVTQRLRKREIQDMDQRATEAREAVTVVYTWEVTPGGETEFEQWAHGVEAEAAAFTGHRGVTWLRPEDDSHRYHPGVRFADTESLDRWLSRLLQRWLYPEHPTS
jgi:antibiotic biosynthesis monooxygenase (ABM) superfamily enzyme